MDGGGLDDGADGWWRRWMVAQIDAFGLVQMVVAMYSGLFERSRTTGNWRAACSDLPYHFLMFTFLAEPCSDKSLSLNFPDQFPFDRYMHLQFKMEFLLARGTTKVCFI